MYWTDPEDADTVRGVLEAESRKYPEFHVECGPLTFWSPAEDYHQKYLERNPGGYCHIPMWKIALLDTVIGTAGKFHDS